MKNMKKGLSSSKSGLFLILWKLETSAFFRLFFNGTEKERRKLKVCTLLAKLFFFGGFLAVDGLFIVFEIGLLLVSSWFSKNHEKTMKKLPNNHQIQENHQKKTNFR